MCTRGRGLTHRQKLKKGATMEYRKLGNSGLKVFGGSASDATTSACDADAEQGRASW